MKLMMSGTIYERLKWLCLIAMPALAFFYGKLAELWGLPFGQAIPDTINLVATFLGILIGISTYNYNNQGKGEFK